MISAKAAVASKKRKVKRRKSARRPTGRAEQVHDYVRLYQHALAALKGSLSPVRRTGLHAIATVGHSEIWPCVDAAVVLTYSREDLGVEVQTKTQTRVSAFEFLQTSQHTAFFNAASERTSIRLPLKDRDASRSILEIAEPIIQNDGINYRPRFQRCSVVGWDAALGNPSREALLDFRAALAVSNAGQHRGVAAAWRVLDEFRALLERANREEEIQAFVKQHPVVLYPEYNDCHPKMALGSEYKTDFVFLIQGLQGPEHVFVEIEDPGKPVVTQAGHFSAEFTQAKDQLLLWETWVTNNHAYLRAHLPGLNKPSFHLVMGRNSRLDAASRAKLQNDFAGTTRRFSTYDDIADRLEQILSRLEPRPKPA